MRQGLKPRENGADRSAATGCRGFHTCARSLTPADLTPCVREAQDGSGSFEVTAYVVHFKELFRTLLRVESDGVVMMLDDEPLGRIVGLQ